MGMEKSILEKLHKNMLEIYQEISQICDRHNLTYFVVGGTLLGAEIHKGYIPWDDDLDIAMPREDYDKFIDVYSKELGERFYLHHTKTDQDYWLPFAKVRLNHTVFLEEKRKNVKAHAGIYVDIFPFDYASKKNTILHKMKWRLMTYLNNYINQKVTGNNVSSRSSFFLNWVWAMFSISKLSLFRDKLMRSFDKGERKYFVDLAGGRRLDNSYFLISDILPIKEMKFGTTTVKAPNNSESYLLQLYTEKYKIIPPVEEQVTHNPLEIKFEEDMIHE